MTTKEIALKTIEQLPENASWEDIQEWSICPPAPLAWTVAGHPERTGHFGFRIPSRHQVTKKASGLPIIGPSDPGIRRVTGAREPG
jgi:hypothetical protein